MLLCQWKKGTDVYQSAILQIYRPHLTSGWKMPSVVRLGTQSQVYSRDSQVLKEKVAVNKNYNHSTPSKAHLWLMITGDRSDRRIIFRPPEPLDLLASADYSYDRAKSSTESHTHALRAHICLCIIECNNWVVGIKFAEGKRGQLPQLDPKHMHTMV